MLRVTVEYLPDAVPQNSKIVGFINIANVGEQDGVSELKVQMFQPNASAIALVQNPDLLGAPVQFTVNHPTREDGWCSMLEEVFRFASGTQR